MDRQPVLDGDRLRLRPLVPPRETIGGRLVEQPEFRPPIAQPHVIYTIDRKAFASGPLSV